MSNATHRRFIAPLAFATLLLLQAPPGLGQTPPAPSIKTEKSVTPNVMVTPATLEQSLVGHWRGALEYRDYQSNETFQLPMETRIALGKDGATITRLSAFDDGPATGMVHITTVSLFDAASARVTSAVFRKGREVEVWTDQAEVLRHDGDKAWSVVYRHVGTDGQDAAEIRVTQTLAGDELLAVKEVKAVDAPDSAFAFRNQVRLKRVAPVAGE